MIIIRIITWWALLCARPCAKCFSCFISFNAHSSLTEQIPLLFSLYTEETSLGRTCWWSQGVSDGASLGAQVHLKPGHNSDWDFQGYPYSYPGDGGAEARVECPVAGPCIPVLHQKVKDRGASMAWCWSAYSVVVILLINASITQWVWVWVCACVCVHACVLPSINGSSLEWETLSLVISRISLSSVLLNVYWALNTHASALSWCSFEAELGVLCVINKNKMMRQ